MGKHGKAFDEVTDITTEKYKLRNIHEYVVLLAILNVVGVSGHWAVLDIL